jgi:hypothetical protein
MNKILSPKVKSIGNLYFPELRDEVENFFRIYTPYSITVLDYVIEIIDAKKDEAARKAITEEYFEKYFNPNTPALDDATNRLKSSARNLIVKIMDVEE